MDIPNSIELKAHEQVLEVVRASLAPQCLTFAFAMIWTVLPFFFLFPLWRQGSWGALVFFVWLSSGAFMLCRLYLKWARTVFVVTDMRVVDCDQRGFFYRIVTEARFEQIDEVSVQVKGMNATLFHYGTLQLKLHGEAADIEISCVNHPEHIANLINDLRSHSRQPFHAVT